MLRGPEPGYQAGLDNGTAGVTSPVSSTVPSPGEERVGSVGTLSQHLNHCQWEQSLGCQHAGKEGTAWLAGQGAGSVWGAGGGQMWCRQS